MVNFPYHQEDSIDILTLQGYLDDDALLALKQTISTLRQQSSTRLLLLADDFKGFKTQNIAILSVPVRMYIQTGGKIALACFPASALRVIKTTLFSRYLNYFQTKEDALFYLKP
jgi:ABC-type transporter Mla MlaB component